MDDDEPVVAASRLQFRREHVKARLGLSPLSDHGLLPACEDLVEGLVVLDPLRGEEGCRGSYNDRSTNAARAGEDKLRAAADLGLGLAAGDLDGGGEGGAGGVPDLDVV